MVPMTGFLLVILFVLEVTFSEETCHVNNECGTVVELEDIEDSWRDKDKIFFIESSDRPYLKARQACAVESAVLRAGNLPVIVVMTSPILDTSNNATCQVYEKYSNSEVYFRTANKKKIFTGTPLQKLYEDGRIDNSPTPIVHYRLVDLFINYWNSAELCLSLIHI